MDSSHPISGAKSPDPAQDNQASIKAARDAGRPHYYWDTTTTPEDGVMVASHCKSVAKAITWRVLGAARYVRAQLLGNGEGDRGGWHRRFRVVHQIGAVLRARAGMGNLLARISPHPTGPPPCLLPGPPKSQTNAMAEMREPRHLHRGGGSVGALQRLGADLDAVCPVQRSKIAGELTSVVNGNQNVEAARRSPIQAPSCA